MAAIARFISFDGGIAFSAASLKIQKRDEEQGKIIPVAEIEALEVSEPLFGDDGSITVRLNGERRASGEHTLYFDDEQYGDAVQFKVAFDTMREESRAALPPLDMFQPEALAPAPARRAAPRGAQRPARPRPDVRREYEEPARPQRRRAGKRGGKLKKIALWVAGVYAVLFAVGGIALLFDGDAAEPSGGGGILETEPTADVSEAWAPEDVAPSADEFLAAAREAMSGKTPDDEPVTDVTLIDGDLHITVDYSRSSTFTDFENWSELLDTFLINSNNALAEAVLGLGEQYDVLWNTITVDFGEYGKVVNEKSAVAVMDMSEYGIDRQGRYFPSENSVVIHDNPVPSAPVVVGYTSPPVITEAPATPTPKPVPKETSYVLNTSTMKFHSPGCRDVGKINAGNRQDYTGTRDSVIAMGYSPCGHCNP